jgi:protein-L-isoaspartate(D-aspartate) O-methyltransferase
VDYAAERERMVERQLAQRGIGDERVLAAMREVPRERFLPEHVRDVAYEDGAVAIACGQTMSQPWIVAYMAQALELAGDEGVLEVGTGSGYGAAVLGRLAREVWTLERHSQLAERAAATLAELGYEEVHVRVGDGTLGLPDVGPFEGISVTAAAPAPPSDLLRQLAPGGVLVAPVSASGRDGPEVLTRFRHAGGELTAEPFVECRFVPLIGERGYPAA